MLIGLRSIASYLPDETLMVDAFSYFADLVPSLDIPQRTAHQSPYRRCGNASGGRVANRP
jgi:hypothetical protein